MRKIISKRYFEKSLIRNKIRIVASSLVFLKWICEKIWNKKPLILENSNPVRRKVDSQTIRTRIANQGWILREIPIKKNHPNPTERSILQWKITAIKNGKSIEVGGKTIDEALNTIGKTLGLVPV